MVLPLVARAQFVYYTPLTVRSRGMGSVASADPSDGGNAWANPSLISNFGDLESGVYYGSYSVAMADFSDLSALIGGSYSAPRFGIAAALAYHREAVRIGERHQSDDAYNIGIAAQAFVGQLRVSLGLAHKSYSLPDIANKNRNAMNDVGVLIAWASSEQGTWHFDGSVGYSWMNNGDEVRTELFGPIQLFTIERGGVWWG
jgi:hypothetical protein